MNDQQRREAQALLSRAATAEAQRQAARAAGDRQAEEAAVDELRKLWRLYTDLERAPA